MGLYYLVFKLVSVVVPAVSDVEGEDFLKVFVMSGSGDDIIGLLVLKSLNLLPILKTSFSSP
jgi:hypothetical protein